MIEPKKGWQERKQNLKESAIVFGFFTGILLPLRILFVTYVSQNWFGSFGVMTIVSVIILILAKKNMLGRFGKMFLRQMTKNQHGKRALFFYGESAILISILLVSIIAINLGNTVYVDQKQNLEFLHPELKDQNTILKETKNVSLDKLVVAIALLPLLTISKFPQMAILFATLNDAFHGWILNMYTIALVEYLEIFGVLLFYRFSLPKNLNV